MAETVLTPGVTTKEIDLSQPTFQGIRGTPAGVIGISEKGPAFVPVTFGNVSNFIETFGAISSESFGSLAVQQWLSNASACTFIRVLGIGDGKQRNSNGTVTNAGFYVGDESLQKNGLIQKNPYANHHATASIKGRTYFLGCFMSESNGSTIFSDAGIQDKVTINNINAYGQTSGLTGGTEVTFTSKLSGTAGNGVTVQLQVEAAGVYGAGNFNVTIDGTSSAIRIVWRLNSTEAGYGTSEHLVELINTGEVADFTGTLTLNDTNNLRSLISASGGSSTVLTDGDDQTVTLNSGVNRRGGAVPIIRGILLAPSGVVLTLSGNHLPLLPGGGNRNTLPTNKTVEAAVSSLGSVDGIRGSSTGSYNMKENQFQLILNGHNGDKRTINASFNMVNASGDSSNYFVNVFNKDPSKIEEEGHLLYSYYDIYDSMADITGSGIYSRGKSRDSEYQDIAFILTSSLGRNESPGSTGIPDYEDFRDRFTHAETPYIISQNYAGKPYNLFKLISIHSGESISNKIRCFIENINYSNNKYGLFDLVVRDFNDSDDGFILEKHPGLSLDPESTNYIARKIGDQNTYFDFDNSIDSQKIIVEGSFPIKSKYFRVKVSSDVENKNIPIDAIPFGFRGPNHLITSGSFLSTGSSDSSVYSIYKKDAETKINPLLGVIEPPIPYRKNITTGEGQFKTVNGNLYWGIQNSIMVKPQDTNYLNNTKIGEPLAGFIKHYPGHRKDTSSFSVGDNHGKPKLRGQIVDSDLFNYNKFSLHNIAVVTGSYAEYNRRAIPDVDAWKSAYYNRKGIPDINHSNKTRGLIPEDLLETNNINFAKFSFFFQGGFDGNNIFSSEKQKLTNNAVKYEIDDSTKQGGLKGPTVSAYRKAIDILGSKDDADIQILTVPGQRNPAVTDYAISSVENRFDALLIMDIEERDQSNFIVTGSDQQVSPTYTINHFKNRNLDTSFAAAYFPDVNLSINNETVKVPPTVALMGALGANDLIGNTWTAPAGVNRTILNNVESLDVPLHKSRIVDNLYSADINPIISIPAYGIVVWGQKTLLKNQSSLDRINVRRLLIDIRRKVRNVANTLLFEPNREETLAAFTALVNPILKDIKDQRGIKRYKVIIDTSTTTQADIENNTVRGKIYLEPTTAAEFIALDFVVSNTGAEI